MESLKVNSHQGAQLERKTGEHEVLSIHGRYDVECIDKNGKLKWKDTIENLVTTEGKNFVLESILGTAVTVVGPYMGLISLASYTGINATDTQASHSGWLEAGVANAPTYTIPRKTCVWSAASAGAKALSAALSFAITGTGTVKGCFIVLGTGALSTIANTAGVLFSVGLFTGGDKAVADTDTLNVSYTANLNAA